MHAPNVNKIYALLRKSDSGRSPLDRQREAFGTRSVDPVMLNSDKLELLESVLTEPHSIPTITHVNRLQIRSTVSHVVHLGWNINRTVPLKTFEPDVCGLRALIDLAATARIGKPARLVYASSVAIFRREFSDAVLRSCFSELEYVLDKRSPIAESALLNPNISLSSGYPESKWVSERLLELAMEKIPGFSATTVRIHQLTGGLNGAWKSTEWFPAMVSASVVLGCFPTGNDSVSWLPADVAATAMLDILNCRDSVLHLRHPMPIAWNDMAIPLAQLLDVTTVPFPEWLACLEREWKAQGVRPVSPYLVSAFRTMHIYQSACPPEHPARGITKSNGIFPMLSIDKAISASWTLQDPQLRQDDFVRWFNYWRHVDHLPN
ncbi:hypothetical protein NEOLEDRAFT_1064539 [Neolentinus lepideus HHB14362 ss-1]|uniref:Thioester reductase (TE) domain-containing protein n=1 Tax=Neolentinus lepideus HHB14362 ss-1 TaxID=1314782 RepID=A0A165STI9_9AGAM|nr:hypothetical protein NEOLEDRAFT_1064539 [Neolentinus lepideus HHB14362 ss-1]